MMNGRGGLQVLFVSKGYKGKYIKESIYIRVNNPFLKITLANLTCPTFGTGYYFILEV